MSCNEIVSHGRLGVHIISEKGREWRLPSAEMINASIRSDANGYTGCRSHILLMYACPTILLVIVELLTEQGAQQKKGGEKRLPAFARTNGHPLSKPSSITANSFHLEARPFNLALLFS